MIEVKVPEEEEMPPNNHGREEAHSIIKLLVNAYNMGYKDGVEAYKAMMEIERGEAHWIMCGDEDGIYGVCDICGADSDFSHNGEAYPYCPYCGAKMTESEDKYEEKKNINC